MVNNGHHKSAASQSATQFVDIATIMGSAYAPFLTECGENSRAFFARVYQKACSFSQQPVRLTMVSGSNGWGNQLKFKVPRTADYLNGLHLRVSLGSADASAVSVMNVGHQLVAESNLMFNEMIAQTLDSAVLNLTQAHHVPNSQKRNYFNMITGMHAANPATVSTSHSADVANQGDAQDGANSNACERAREIIQPLPYWFCQQGNSGAALPVAAIPYNEVVVELQLAAIEDLFVNQPAQNPSLSVELWANSIIVSNEERAAMACNPRDVLMRQFEHQTASRAANSNVNLVNLDLRFNGAVLALYAGAHGNRADASGNLTVTAADPTVYCDASGTSLVRSLGVTYDNTARVGTMPYTHFQYVQPYFHAVGSGYSGVRDEGLLMYSFALDVNSFDHTGYVDMGKLSKATVEVGLAANQGLAGSDPNATLANNDVTVDVVAEKLNIGRFSGGAFGMPVL
tara:strand:- start:459 stop:1829 length:1371 start_codon:yes stop_codon:yes gene_type:complete